MMDVSLGSGAGHQEIPHHQPSVESDDLCCLPVIPRQCGDVQDDEKADWRLHIQLAATPPPPTSCPKADHWVVWLQHHPHNIADCPVIIIIIIISNTTTTTTTTTTTMACWRARRHT